MSLVWNMHRAVVRFNYLCKYLSTLPKHTVANNRYSF